MVFYYTSEYAGNKYSSKYVYTNRNILKNFMSWCFAIINNKLAEIYFDKNLGSTKSKIVAHCYVAEQDYLTKEEKIWIKRDTKKFRFTYRNGNYKRKL